MTFTINMDVEKIILVHSGCLLPEYLDTCIRQLHAYSLQIHLLIEKRFCAKFNDNAIIVSPIEDYIDVDYQSFEIVGRDNQYRDNFWTRTSSRFFLIRNYAQKNAIKNFWHIENDILVFSNLIEYGKILRESYCDMALIIDAPYRCVPSIMWFKDDDILNKLCSFLKKRPSEDDMTNIAFFYHQNKNNLISLPTTPSHQNFLIFKSCFDGAAIGQFLAGTFQGGLASKGFINETTDFNPAQFEYHYRNKKPYIKLNDTFIEINNLHIHSKQLQSFLESITRE